MHIVICMISRRVKDDRSRRPATSPPLALTHATTLLKVSIREVKVTVNHHHCQRIPGNMAIVEDLPESDSGAYSTSVSPISIPLSCSFDLVQTDIPLRHPDRRKASSTLLDPPTPPGSRKSLPPHHTHTHDLEEMDGGMTEEIFDTIMLTVPFSFLFLLLHMYVFSATCPRHKDQDPEMDD